MRYDLEHATDDNRCIKCNKFQKIEGSDYCARHGANSQIESQNKKSMYNIKAQEVRARINVLAADPRRYTLDEELGVTRLLIEEVLNNIKPGEIYKHADSLSSLIGQCQKLVDSALKISAKMRLLMTPEDVNKIIQRLVDVLDDKIEDKELLDGIATDLLTTLDAVFDSRQTLGQDNYDPS